MRIKVLPSFVVLLFGCVVVLLPIYAFSQVTDEPLPVEEMLSARTFADYTPMDFSPDGEWVSYTLQDNRRKESPGDARYRLFSRTGVYFYGKGGDIWITNTKSGVSKNLTGSQGNNWSPAWSPDGRYIAFYSDRGGEAKVWVWEKATGKLRQVSKATVRSLADPIQWTPDSRQVIVKLLPEGMSLEDAANLLIANQEQSLGEKKTIGSTVVVYGAAKAASQGNSVKPEATSSQTPPWSFTRYLADLALIDIDSGQVKRVVQRSLIRRYWLSPDGSSVVYATPKKFEVAGSQQILFNLMIYSFSGGQSRVVAPNIQLDYDGSSVSWSPDGKTLGYRTAGQLAKGDVFVVSAMGGDPRNLTATPHPNFSGFGLQPPLWDAAGRNVYFIGDNAVWKASLEDGKISEVARIPDQRIELIISTDRNRLWAINNEQSTIVRVIDKETKQDGFYKIDLVNGQSTVLFNKGKLHSNPLDYGQIVSNDGQRMVYLSQDTQHGADLWLAGADFRSPKRLTKINPQLERYKMGAARLIEWISIDGQRLKGALLLPPGYQEGKRYPLIIKVYSGLLSNELNNFGFARSMVDNLQVLATRGYAVLLPDSPVQVGAPMANLLKTVMPGVNKVVEMGIADPDRLGLMGHSNGGYSTLALLVQTKQFKVAVMSAGHGDMLAQYGLLGEDGTNYGLGFVEQSIMGGTPWEYRERYIENSPIYYLDRVQTPLLIVHGGEDDAVSPYLAGEVFVGLRRLGKEVTYAKYEGEEHWQANWGYANQVDYLRRIIDWFDTHLKKPDKTPTSERKPN